MTDDSPVQSHEIYIDGCNSSVIQINGRSIYMVYANPFVVFRVGKVMFSVAEKNHVDVFLDIAIA